MKTSHLFALALLLALLPPGSTRAASLLDPWDIYGSNSLHLEYYDVHGDEGASPYPTEGSQLYDDVNLNVSRRLSPFDSWRGQLSGVVNDSDYRSQDQGLVLERFNLVREKGDVAAPYRLEFGDYYGFFSTRTFQSSLKGAQVEVQPPFAGLGHHSLLFAVGANQPSWRHLRAGDNASQGLSYLIDDPAFGRYSLNVVNNRRQGDAVAGTLDRAQQVYSLAGERVFAIGGQTLTTEGEFGLFHGDHDGSTGAASGQDRSASGLFLQANGASPSPLTYRLRYEEYGEDYRPEGAAISPDSRAVEGHAGWRFASGVTLRGRVQGFRDAKESNNPTDTRTYGLNLSGYLPWGSLGGNLDTFVQDTDNRDKTTDNRFASINLNLNAPLAGEWTGLAGILYQDLESRGAGSPDSTTRQLNLSAVHPFGLAGCTGSIGPGVVVRNVSDPKASELLPTVNLGVSRGAHSLDYALAYSVQDQHTTAATDVATFSSNLLYRYLLDNDAFSLELVSEHRGPSPGLDTTSTKIGLFWTHSFAKPVRSATARPEMAPAVSAMAGGGPDLATLTALTPGVTMTKARQELASVGLTGAVEQPGAVVFETRLINEIDQRQRLALVDDGGGRLRKSALIIDFADIGSQDDLIRTMERIRGLLIQSYGRPANFHEEGEVSGDLITAIRNGQFVRVMEWTRPGGVMRYGIPRRLDGQIRLEVQFAKGFPPVQDSRWSIEEVR